MALTKVRRGGTDTGISDSSDATAITIDSSENVGIGTTSPTLTNAVLNTGVSGTAIKDEDDMASDSNVKLATQQSIKAYVDSQVTAQDLDITTDSGSIDIDLDSEALTIAGGEGIDTSATGTTVTIAGEDASTSNKGIASFNSDNFAASSGDITINISF